MIFSKSISRRFYPTQLASNLVNGLTHADKSLEGEGFIVAETNYRVYAYTGIYLHLDLHFHPNFTLSDSELQFRILSLFCEMMYRLVTSSSIVMISLMSSQQIPKSLRNANHSRKCTNSGCKWDNSRSNLTLHPSKCSCWYAKRSKINILRWSLQHHWLQDPIIAPTLADQIRLWAMERDRLNFRDGVLYNQFLAQKDFEKLKKHAKVTSLLLL